MASSLLPRSVRRYRARNPYSFAFFFNCLDAIIGVLKIAAVLLVLAACWKAYFVWIDARKVDQLVESDLTRIVNTDLPSVSGGASNSTASSSEETLRAPAVSEVQPVLSGPQVSESVLFDEAWLMSLDRDKFTVQLGTSPELDKLVAFAREVFAAEQAHIFPFRVSSIGNPIYGLAFGEHVDLQAAQEAVALFPAAYRQYDPWIRPVGQLQDQVQDTRSKLGL